MKTKAPFAVTTMRLTVLILASWNILRLGATLVNWSVLAEFAPRPSPIYIAFTAAFWTLACLAVWTLIGRRNAQSQGYYAMTVLGYIAWWWADRLFLFGEPRLNWPFAAVITAIFLFDTIAAFFNGSATDYFTQRENHEQPSSDQQTS
jgi:hypothetical protein